MKCGKGTQKVKSEYVTMVLETNVVHVAKENLYVILPSKSKNYLFYSLYRGIFLQTINIPCSNICTIECYGW